MAFVEITCRQCQKPFRIQEYFVKKQGRKHCSQACYSASRRGKPGATKGMTWKISPERTEAHPLRDRRRNGFFLGKTHSEESKAKQSLAKLGVMVDERNANWRGNDVGYYSLHHWLYGKFGSPDTCEHCGKSNLTGHQIHWANKTGEYLRDRNDWLRLCVSCHKHYDMLNGIRINERFLIGKRG